MPEAKRPDLMGGARLALSPVAAAVGDGTETSKMIETGDPDFPSLPAWIDFTASTGAENRYEDMIEQKRWRLASCRKSPVVLRMPQLLALPLGTGKARIADQNPDNARLMIRIKWDLKQRRVREIADKYHRKILRAGSVYAIPGKGTWRADLDTSHPAD